MKPYRHFSKAARLLGLNYVLLYLLVLSALPSSGQKIYFTDTTNVWRGLHIEADGQLISTFPYQYTYHQDTVMSGITYKILGDAGRSRIAVREDTSAGHIYFRFVNADTRAMAIDTLEHLLYDYTLQVNDTFKLDIGTDHSYAAVTSISSCIIGSNAYKIWHFDAISSNNGTSFPTHLGDVVEGLGSDSYPLWPVAFWIFEDLYQLHCFSNKGSHPVMAPSIRLPFYAMTPFYGPPTTDYFDNAASCSLAAGDVGRDKDMVTVFPNPVTSNSVLKCSKVISKGHLTIYNSIGQQVASRILTNTATVNVGSLISVPGIYYYQVADDQNKHTNAGHLILQ